MDMRLRRYAVNFPTPQEARRVPLPEITRKREWLYKAEVAMTSVDECY